jgi:hypothetical protein
VTDNLARRDAVDGEHPNLYFLAGRGNPHPRGALVRIFHPQSHPQAIALAQHRFDAEAKVGEARDPARNMLLDCL